MILNSYNDCAYFEAQIDFENSLDVLSIINTKERINARNIYKSVVLESGDSNIIGSDYENELIIRYEDAENNSQSSEQHEGILAKIWGAIKSMFASIRDFFFGSKVAKQKTPEGSQFIVPQGVDKAVGMFKSILNWFINLKEFVLDLFKSKADWIKRTMLGILGIGFGSALSIKTVTSIAKEKSIPKGFKAVGNDFMDELSSDIGLMLSNLGDFMNKFKVSSKKKSKKADDTEQTDSAETDDKKDESSSTPPTQNDVKSASSARTIKGVKVKGTGTRDKDGKITIDENNKNVTAKPLQSKKEQTATTERTIDSLISRLHNIDEYTYSDVIDELEMIEEDVIADLICDDIVVESVDDVLLHTLSRLTPASFNKIFNEHVIGKNTIIKVTEACDELIDRETSFDLYTVVTEAENDENNQSTELMVVNNQKDIDKVNEILSDENIEKEPENTFYRLLQFLMGLLRSITQSIVAAKTKAFELFAKKNNSTNIVAVQ